MALPELLGKQLMHQIIGRVLDHLDLFEDHLFLALDVFVAKRWVEHEIRENVERAGQVLIEHFDVVAGTLLRRERIQLSANRIDRLRDVLGSPPSRSFEQHVLDEMRDASALVVFMPRATCQPDADTDGPHVRHRLGDKAEAVSENLANDHS